MNLIRIVLPVCCLLFNGNHVQAQDSEKIKTFEEAKMNGIVQPHYPISLLSHDEEGWVVVNVMVDEAGNTFEPTVVDSMGSPEFQAEALRAIKATKFTPAMSSGKPVISSHRMQYAFVLPGREKASRKDFADSYRLFLYSIEKNNREQTEKNLSKLENIGSMSLYEDAFLNLAKFYYAAKYEDRESQMKYLSRALYISNENTFATYLPQITAKELWPNLFALQVKNNRFAEALKTLDIMQKVEDKKTIQAVAPVTQEIKTLRDNDTAYKIKGHTNESGSWHVLLYKDEFYLENVNTKIDEIKLRCEKKYIFFKYTADTKYKIPAEYGKCGLEILGDANTSFVLVQL